MVAEGLLLSELLLWGATNPSLYDLLAYRSTHAGC